MVLVFKFLEQEITYTGKEIRSGWVREQIRQKGDVAAVFFGPCRVATEDLVDMDDYKAQARIESDLMAHIIIEHPSIGLKVAVLRQRLLMCIIGECLAEMGVRIHRVGDDLYHDDRKLTVSIAAPSHVSSLIHTGINVRPGNAPVPAIGLEELGVNAYELLEGVMNSYREELEGCAYAEGKVRKVP